MINKVQKQEKTKNIMKKKRVAEFIFCQKNQCDISSNAFDLYQIK